jgi:hypothetical protein
MRFTNHYATLALMAATIFAGQAQAGPLAYAACQVGCSVAVGACYTAAGFTFGTVLAAAAPPAILACNAAQATCYASCAALAFAPTP